MNTIINFITGHWFEFICTAVLICFVVYIFKDFFSLSREQQSKQIKSWLLGAVTLAEKEFGSGTGKIKLSVVYDSFVEKFPWIAKVLSFDTFSGYVDEALDEMRKLLDENDAVAEYVASDNSEVIILADTAKGAKVDKEG